MEGENIGDWLYILFLAIAGISSMFSSKKKKKQPKQILGQPDRKIVAEEESVPDKGFWEALEEMQNPKTTKRSVAAPKPKREQTVICREPPCRSPGQRRKPAYGYRVRQCRRTEKSCYLH